MSSAATKNIAIEEPWLYEKDVMVLINPIKRKKILKKYALTAFFIAFVIFMASDSSPLLSWAKSWEKKEEVAYLSPKMHELAAAGKPDAILWLAKHEKLNPNTLENVKKLAQSGNGEALFFMFNFISWENYKNGINNDNVIYLKRSAEAGYAPAMIELSRRENKDQK